MLEILIPLAVVGLGIALLYYGHRLWLGLATRPGLTQPSKPEPQLESIIVERGVAPDELVYLFSHRFSIPGQKARPTEGRHNKIIAPLTDEKIDAQHLANQMLYATLTELHRQGCVDIRIVQRDPTFMPPFPQKCWELELRRCGRLPGSPICDCMQVTFELLEKKQRNRVKARAGDNDTEPSAEDLYVPLDDLLDRALRVMRQELTFWEKKGVYGDLSNYVASALVATGYLEDVTEDTWLDKVRPRRLTANRQRIEAVEKEAERLAARMADFRRRYGSEEAQEEDQPGGPVHGNVCPQVMTGGEDPSGLPLDDCLRVSIYETLVSLRQLEPSGGV